MLGRKTKDARGGTTPAETHIGQGTRFEGTLVAHGALRIEGEVIGEIRSEGDVFVADSGDVKADVVARNLIVGGRLTGKVNVSERLELLETGKVVGDASMRTLIVEQGGVLEGHCQMHSDNDAAFKEARLDPAG